MDDFECFRRISIEDTGLLANSLEYKKFFQENKIVTLRDLFLKSSKKEIIYTLNPLTNRELITFINLCKLKYLGIPIKIGINPWKRHHYSFWLDENNLKKISYLGFNLKRVIATALEVYDEDNFYDEDNSYNENFFYSENNSCLKICQSDDDCLLSFADILINDEVIRRMGNTKISDEEMNALSLISWDLKNTLNNVDVLACDDISLLQAKKRELLKEEETLRLTRKMINRRINTLQKNNK